MRFLCLLLVPFFMVVGANASEYLSLQVVPKDSVDESTESTKDTFGGSRLSWWRKHWPSCVSQTISNRTFVDAQYNTFITSADNNLKHHFTNKDDVQSVTDEYCAEFVGTSVNDVQICRNRTLKFFAYTNAREDAKYPDHKERSPGKSARRSGTSVLIGRECYVGDTYELKIFNGINNRVLKVVKLVDDRKLWYD